ncbi:MAG: sulfatase, partial [Holophagales bacterium]|nr:sulfatase [Holophagales bacterium]
MPRSLRLPPSLARTAAGTLAGAAAGASALILDQWLAFATLGDSLPPVPGMATSYIVTGAILGTIAALWPSRRSRAEGEAAPERPPWGLPYGVALVGLYALPVAERMADAAFVRGGKPAAVIAALTGAVAMLVAAHGAVRLARCQVPPLLLVAITAAVGLAVNRNLLDHPLAASSLAADAGIVLAAAAVTWAMGRVTPEKAAMLLAGLVAAGIGIVFVLPSRAPYPAPPPARGGEPPHLILIVLDTLRLDVFESVLRETEEGRELAAHLADAAFFDNAMAASPWTAPSMGTILTGLYPAEHGFGTRPALRDRNRSLLPLAEAVPTLGTRLAQRGWHTEAIIANPILFPGSGIDRGFVHYEVLDSTVKKLPLLMVMSRMGMLDPERYQPAPQVLRRLESRLPALTSSGRPLFLWLHFLDPHDPYHDHPELPTDASAATLPDDERRYREEVRFTARSVSRSIELLDRHGLWRDSLAILVSDHGEMFPTDGHVNPILDPATGQPQTWGHGKSLYHELVRIPLVIRPPGGLPEGAPRRTAALVSHIDLHDTVVEVLGLDVPPIGRDRLSLAPFLDPPDPGMEAGGEPATGALGRGRSWALLGGIQAGIPQRGYVTRRHKFVIY